MSSRSVLMSRVGVFAAMVMLVASLFACSLAVAPAYAEQTGTGRTDVTVVQPDYPDKDNYHGTHDIGLDSRPASVTDRVISSLPKTGDSLIPIALAILMTAGAFVFVIVVARRRRREENEDA